MRRGIYAKLEGDDGEVEVEDGGGEEEGVGEIEDAADAGEGMAGVFDLGAAFDDGFGEVTGDAGEAEDGGDDEAVGPGDGEEFVGDGGEKDDGTADGGDEGADKTFPGFCGADVGDHLVFADEDTQQIGAHVREFGYDEEEEEEEDTAGFAIFEMEVEDAEDEAVKDDGVNDAEDEGKDALEGDDAFEVMSVAEEEAALNREGEGGEVKPHGRLALMRENPPTDGDPVGDADDEAEEGEGAMGIAGAEEAEVFDGAEDAEEGRDGDEEPVLFPFESDGENGPEEKGAGEATGEDASFAGGLGRGAGLGHRRWAFLEGREKVKVGGRGLCGGSRSGWLSLPEFGCEVPGIFRARWWIFRQGRER